tara:strand:- start:1899 stop:2711 length:813 start_codon:yes stop_codon:yes gene_type:complete
MSNGEETQPELNPSMTSADLEALLLSIAPMYAAPESNANNPLLGYSDELVASPGPMVMRPGAEPIQQTIMSPDEIRLTDVQEILAGLDSDDKDALALEMLGAGVFDDINDVFDDNFQRDEIVFNALVEQTINLAAEGTNLGFETTFLKVLMGAGDSDTSTIMKSIAEAKAKAAEEKKTGGRVIQWANPQGLVRSLKEESKGTLGRKATKREQQQFVKRIHNMQAKGLSVNVAAEAEAFQRQSAPVEAAAMDMSQARNSVMKVIMSRLGKA